MFECGLPLAYFTMGSIVYTHTYTQTHIPMCVHRHFTLENCSFLSSLIDSVNKELCNTFPVGGTLTSPGMETKESLLPCLSSRNFVLATITYKVRGIKGQ